MFKKIHIITREARITVYFFFFLPDFLPFPFFFLPFLNWPSPFRTMTPRHQDCRRIEAFSSISACSSLRLIFSFSILSSTTTCSYSAYYNTQSEWGQRQVKQGQEKVTLKPGPTGSRAGHNEPIAEGSTVTLRAHLA